MKSHSGSWSAAILMTVILLLALSSSCTEARPLRFPPPPTPPCQSACNGDFRKCINSASICQEQFDACMRLCQ
ncbi:MAG: hypothetical protein J3R72DRAFT_450805 [Linnemannia gamsii]|nr:MAG: hypothetical protein J3R72DRAFT_450805 [Linnemannia gamsii]